MCWPGLCCTPPRNGLLQPYTPIMTIRDCASGSSVAGYLRPWERRIMRPAIRHRRPARLSISMCCVDQGSVERGMSGPREHPLCEAQAVMQTLSDPGGSGAHSWPIPWKISFRGDRHTTAGKTPWGPEHPQASDKHACLQSCLSTNLLARKLALGTPAGGGLHVRLS